jgi:ribose 5-phosphate isomerase A
MANLQLDYRKLQPRLLTNWKTIPIEVEPLAVRAVLDALKLLGSSEPKLRIGQLDKAGPIKTDQGFYVIDAPFAPLAIASDLGVASGQASGWQVNKLAKEIKEIEGVLSVGIFAGENGEQIRARGLSTGGQKPVAVYFGMSDGSVLVKTAGQHQHS